jgi:hypothetical protein
MRSAFGLARGIVAILTGCAIAAACSAVGSNKGKTGQNAGGGQGSGVGGDLNLGSNASGGTVNVNDPDSGNPLLTSCSRGSDCAAGDVCVLTESGGLCSPNGGACTASGNECVNDSYCCLAVDGCKLDGVSDATCVSNATRPVDDTCKSTGTVGLFSPDLQCEWTKPEVGDPYPDKIHVLSTPLVANLPTDSGTAAEIIIVSSDGKANGATVDATSGGRIRILNGQTCKQIEVIAAGDPVRDAATPAIADLDGDGKMEIVARLNGPNGSNGGLVAFQFDGAKYAVMWTSPNAGTGSPVWDGVSIHDLDDDGKPEIIGAGGEVHDGLTGKLIAPVNPAVILASDPALGDLDGDGRVELVANKVFRWSGTGWVEAYPGLGVSTAADAPAFYGFADFGTRTGPGKFDPTKKDGRAEVIGVGPIGGVESSGVVRLYTLEGEPLIDAAMPPGTKCSGGQALGERGGPPTVGDFDGDGMPELATAGAFAYRVFDLGCSEPGASCKDPSRSILWESPTQDCTSAMTGSTIFDFEGDGAAEAIYADECFVRVYSGKTGEVLFSTYRNSATWWEQPIVADPDNSDRSKIIFGGAPLFNVYSQCGNPAAARNCDPTGRASAGCVDPLWAGVRCSQDSDCASQKCGDGYCRCTTDAECGNHFMSTVQNPNDQLSGLACHPPKAGTPGTGNVCRAEFGNITTIAEANKWFAGVKVYRDKLDRWASSRNLWNQHAYSITNINDDGTIPKTSAWAQNFKDPALNNFRQNRQGATSQELADITGALDATTACTQTMDGQVVFTGRICNRGLRGVGSNMPAAFYQGMSRDKVLCQTQTAGPLPKGVCQNIECTIPKSDVLTNATITMVVNDVGGGNRLVDECNYDNNVAQVLVDKCRIIK